MRERSLNSPQGDKNIIFLKTEAGTRKSEGVEFMVGGIFRIFNDYFNFVKVFLLEICSFNGIFKTFFKL